MSAAHARSFVSVVVFVLVSAIAAQADNEIPIPGMAPGTQNGDGAPFTGLAQTPGAQLFTGSATTSVSLLVPRGRLDMTPSLALGYSSQAARGPYGYGWSLNVGRVSRSTKRGVPLYDNDADTFVLELPGAVVELIPDTGKLYRALYDGTYFKIGFDRNANYWKVVDPDGTVFVFGAETTRHSRAGPDTDASETTFAWYLERAEDIYGNAIEYSYVDSGAAAPAPHGLLDRVEYGGNAKAGVAHMFHAQFVWEYTPPQHPRRWEFARGFAAVADDAWTLDRVDSTFIDESGAPSTVRTYDLDYDRDPTTEVARLADVGLVATTTDSTVVLPQSVFLYSAALDLTGWPTGTAAERHGPPSDPYSITITSPSPSGHGFRDTTGKIVRDLVDVNGDALLDSVFLDGGSLEVRLGTGGDFAAPVSWSFPSGFTELRDHVGSLRSNLLDLDGDALPDFVHAAGSDCVATVGDPCWDVYRNNGGGFALTPTPWAAPRNHIQKLDKIEPAPYGQATAVKSNTVDFNNDGLPDFIDAADADNNWDGQWQIYWNTGSGFTSVPDTWTAPTQPGLTIEYLGLTRVKDIAGGDPSASLHGLVDVNGDGLPDLLRSDTDDAYDSGAEVDHWDVWLNNGFGFESVTSWTVPGGAAALPNTFGATKSFTDSTTSARELIDMTGDGLPDLIDRSYYLFNPPTNGCPVGPGSAAQCPLFGGPQPPECCELVALFINTGSGFAAPLGIPHWSNETLVRKNTDPNAAAIGPITDVELLDFDGDGLIDLLESDGTNWHLYPSWMTPRAGWSGIDASERYKPNLLVSTMNGMGAINVLEYAAASLVPDQPCQRDAEGLPVAGACTPFPHWVVTTVESSDSLSSVPTTYTNYAYADGKYDAISREFRGFGRAATIDAEGRTIVTEYHQDAARAGRILRSWTLGNPDCGGGAISAPFDPSNPCNPWSLRLGLEENVWGDPLDPTDPKPVLLLQTRSLPYFDDAPQSHLEKTTLLTYDAYGNERLRTTVSADPLADFAPRTTTVDATYTNGVDSLDGTGMPSRYIVNRPLGIRTTDDARPLHEKRFSYKSLRYAKNVETCRAWVGNGSCAEWTRRSEGRNSLGLVTKSKSESKRRAKFYYSDAFSLYPTRIRDGRLETLPSYDQVLGRPVEIVDPAGEQSRIRYDALGRTIERWGPSPSDSAMGAAWLLEAIEYVEPAPALGLPGRIRRDAAGSAPAVTFYDGLGREIASKGSVETSTGNTVMILTNLADYDAYGRPVAAAAPLEAANQSDVETLATTFAATPPNERTTTLYDVSTGKRTRVVPPNTASVDFEYRAPGIEITRDAAGSMTVAYLDTLGRTYRTERCVDPVDLDAVTPSYECPLAYRRERLEYAFDGMDRPTVTWIQNLELAGQPMEWLRATDYDGLGNQVRVRDRNAGEWLRSYDKQGLHVASTGPDGAQTTFKYKKARLVETRVTRPGLADKLVIKRNYVRRDEAGAGKLERIGTSDGLGTSTRTISYSPRGLVDAETVSTSTVVDGETFTSTFTVTTTYDDANRVVAVGYPKLGADGRLTTEALAPAHNAEGQVVSLTLGGSKTLVADIDYDTYGHTVAIDYGNAVSDRFAYEAQAEGGRLQCVRTTASISTPTACLASPSYDFRALTYDRDIVGRIVQINDQHSSQSQAHSFGTTIDYHDDGRMAAATYRNVLIYAVEKDAYSYDSVGRVRERVRTDAQVDTTIAYDYGAAFADADPDGAIVPLHRLHGYGGTTLAYDGAGRQTTKGDADYRYDQVGRVREVRFDDALVALNQYDEGTARVAKYTPGTGALVHYFGGLFEVHIDVDSQSAELVRHFSLAGRRVASDRSAAPDGLVIVASTGASAAERKVAFEAQPLAKPRAFAGAASARTAQAYIAAAFLVVTCGALLLAWVLFPDGRRTALATTALLVSSILPLPYAPPWSPRSAHAQSLPGKLVYYHLDHVGSVQLVTDDDPSGGRLVEALHYRAYGELRGAFGDQPAYTQELPPFLETNAGYGGHEADGESGLSYFGARHYDPELAMFLSPDSAAQFPSPFAYAGWDPINNFDPDGNVAVLGPLLAALQFVSKVLAVGFAVAAVAANPSAGPMAVVQQYVLSIAGGGWKGVGTLILSTMARAPTSFQTAVQTAHVANTGLNAARAIGNGDTVGAISSISSIAAGVEGTGQGAQTLDESGSAASQQTKYLWPDGAATPSKSVEDTAPPSGGLEGPLLDASYHVSRPLAGGGGRLGSHNFIVTHADFIGDPDATVTSFGEALDGSLSQINADNAGGSSYGTHEADSQFWLSLKGAGPGGNAIPIPASSGTVDFVAAAFPHGHDYSAIAGPFGFNSNTASQWVANTAAGIPQPIPGEPGRLAPGARSWFRIPRAGSP